MSDIDTAAADSLKVLDPERPIREADMNRHARLAASVENDPGCVKTLGGITAPGILGSTVMRRAKKRKNLSSARHYDQIRFRFHTSFAARQQYVCNRGQSGNGWHALKTSLMTPNGHWRREGRSLKPALRSATRRLNIADVC